jgi:N-acetyl-gamma-glutamyl-phosphate reductase
MSAEAVVLGASGFTGGELGRILSRHPNFDVATVGAATQAGRRWRDVQPHLGAAGNLELLPLDDALATDAELCFSCLPSGSLRGSIETARARIVVDLSDDFRHVDAADGWVYGLTEFARPDLKESTRISNPGCYPTAALLCLVPFARRGAIEGPVVIDAMSGVSGAGRRVDDRLMFAGLDGNATAYGTTDHRHVPEIERGLTRFGGLQTTVSFTPHLVPMTRGLLVTARAPLKTSLNDQEAHAILDDAYRFEPFVRVIHEWPSTKPLTASNGAHVSARVDHRNGFVVCSAAIDNLGKGAAGQAVQNANAAFGLDETAGLEVIGAWP